MYKCFPVYSKESVAQESSSHSISENFEGNLEHYELEPEDYYMGDGFSKSEEPKKPIGVGDCLPYGPRMYYETNENVVRMKDIGEKHRILVIGVIGSFTPDCWNRHFYQVLKNLKYYEERDVDYICCIATNDAYTQKAWGAHLGCDDSVLMWADSTKRFTKAMGMDTVVPLLDNNIRSKRYVLLADNMIVTKIICAPSDDKHMEWECEHLAKQNPEDSEEENDDEDEDDDDDENPWV